MSANIRSRAVKILAILALTGGAFVTGIAVAAQPHMFNALHALQNARAELQSAATDKAGHRVEAIELVDRAINEVKLGIGAGR